MKDSCSSNGGGGVGTDTTGLTAPGTFISAHESGKKEEVINGFVDMDEGKVEIGDQFHRLKRYEGTPKEDIEQALDEFLNVVQSYPHYNK